MVLVGVSIDDSITAGQYDVYTISLSGNTSSKVATINAPDPAGASDFEGLATLNGLVYAITESSSPNNIVVEDVLGKQSTITLSGTRFGDDVGSDFSPSGVHYIIQGEDSTLATTGSQLYKVDLASKSITAIGKQSAEFFDGLAISNELFKGSKAIASDFAIGDGDGAELYTIQLTGTSAGAQKLLDRVKFVDNKGNAIGDFKAGTLSDSGLDYDEATNKLYAIADLTNDLYFTTKTDLLDGINDITFKRVNNSLPAPTGGEFEGLALVDVSTSFVSSSASLFDNQAGQDVLSAALATMFDSDAVASV